MKTFEKKKAEKIFGQEPKSGFGCRMSDVERNIDILYTISDGNGGWEWRPRILKELGFLPL